MLRCLILLLVVWASSLPAEVQWSTVLFDGRKVGHAQSERRAGADAIEHAERIELAIVRDGVPLRVRMEERYRESLDGVPLAFESSMDTAGDRQHVRGQRLPDGQFAVELTIGGRRHEHRLELDPGTVFPEGQRLALRRAWAAGQSQTRVLAFDPAGLRSIAIDARFDAERSIVLLETEARLVPVALTVRYPEAPLAMQLYVDREFVTRRQQLELLGMRIDVIACDQACALAPNDPIDYLARLVLPAPTSLDRRAQERGVEYRLRFRRPSPVALPSTGEQTVERHGEDAVLRVCADCGPHSAPSADERQQLTQPTAWMQSDASEIRALADRARAAGTPRAQMQRAEAVVRAHIRDKSLAVGYASALEAARARRGDCTEHALLLGAVGRALGIPTRIATGLAYVADHAGRGPAFVPHAWTQAYVDGRWTSFDAALDGFSGGHIALAIDEGDPARFYAGVHLLGALELAEIHALEADRR